MLALGRWGSRSTAGDKHYPRDIDSSKRLLGAFTRGRVGSGRATSGFKPGGTFDHVGTSVLGLVFVGLALRMVFQEVRAR